MGLSDTCDRPGGRSFPVCAQTASGSLHLYGQAGLAYPFGSLDNHSNIGLQGSFGVGFVPSVRPPTWSSSSARTTPTSPPG